jgi:SAM-dependent methyltransferase
MSEFDAFARYYDADYGAFLDDVPFFRELARRAGGRVIELMCGSGRLLVPLAQAGIQVTGVDISAGLLEKARARIAASHLSKRVVLHQSDIRHDIPPGPFGLAIVALNSFMHLESTDDQLAALANIHGALEPGGILALDLFNPDPRELLRHNGECVLDKTFRLDGGILVQKFVVQSVDMAGQINNVTFIYDELDADGIVRRRAIPFAMRWLYRYEAEHLLVRAGFELHAVYGSYDLDEYASDSPLMLIVARKV